MSPTMGTISGLFVDLIAPRPSSITLRDVAWGLSRIPRYVGHTTGPVYSVAQHSVWCARIAQAFFGAPPTQALAHLLHDASEYVTGDIPAPLKHLPGVHEAIAPIERELQAAIYWALGVTAPDAETQRQVHEVDLLARAVESYHLRPARFASFDLPPVPHEIMQTFLGPLHWQAAYEQFWLAFDLLKEGRQLSEVWP